LEHKQTAMVIGASNAELRSLTVQSEGNSTNIYATAIYNNDASPTLSHLTITASGGTGANYGVYNFSSSPAMNNLTITASGGTGANYGVSNNYSSSPTIYSSRISGGTNSVCNSASSTAKIANTMLDGTINGPSLFSCIGNYDASFATKSCP